MSQGCCGALPQHQGQSDQSQALVRQMIDSFPNLEELDAIIINAAGCGHTLKEYGHILQDDPTYAQKARAFASKVRDVQEFLASIELVTTLQPISDQPLQVVYQDACHLLHGQKISIQPRQLLSRIPQLQLREPLDAGLCCGSAGIYNMLQPEVATELGKQKVANLLNTGATVIASANPGCSLQISQHLSDRGADVSIYHPIELLDRSINGQKLI
jgi:glycolate oxidase iron-sulfur subunit